MAENKRYCIGLMIHHLENEYSTEVLKGAIIAAEELDINLILLPGRGINAVDDDEKYSIYDYQYNVIYNYVSEQNLDALIVSAGTIGSYISQQEMQRFLRSYRNLPLLTMEVEYPDYPCIHFHTGGMKLAVDHLIETRGCTKIGYVSGPIGNPDAMDRLHCYRISMEEHHLPYDNSMIAYGNFSEYSEKAVRELLDAHPDLEAICFANDKMCIGAYQVFEERGITVGKDILVTGFDDSDVATSLKPMLTTIRTNVSDMGYCAVQTAYRMICSGTAESISLDAKLIVRESCGGIMKQTVTPELLSQLPQENTAESIVAMIFDQYIGNVKNLKRTSFIRNTWDILIHMFEEILQGHIPDTSWYLNRMEIVFRETDTIQIQISLLKKILEYAKETACILSHRREDFCLAIEMIYNAALSSLLDYSMRQQHILRSNLTYSNFLITNINNDMMVNSSDEEKSFFSIIKNLHRVNFKSSYIYIFRDPQIHYQYEKWKNPDSFCLKTYHIGKNLQTVYPPNQSIPIYNCIDNDYTPKDRRFTFIMVPLFSNEEQYGLFVCELELNYFSQIYSVAPQICSAIKLTRLVKELEGNLEDARSDNRRLKQMSDSDELTGAFNRRGFYRNTNILLGSEEAAGKAGIVLLADLDNLKIINDTFGHDEGDHALRTCIAYLNASVPLLDTIGRIGGDEFAAFAVVDDADTAIPQIYDSIKNAAAQYNAKSEKPYNITISLGMCAMECSNDKKVQSFIKFADEALYEDKKNKNRIVIKTPQ